MKLTNGKLLGGLVCLMALIAAYLINKSAMYGKPSSVYEERACAEHLRSIGVALRAYSESFGSNSPPDLRTVVNVGVMAEQLIYCPTDHTMTQKQHLIGSYIYFPGRVLSTTSSDVIIAVDNKPRHPNGRNVLFGDGHVECIQDSDVRLRQSAVGPLPR